MAFDLHLARLAQQVGGQVQPAGEAGRPEVGQQLAQIDVRLHVVPVAGLLERLPAAVKPARHRHAVTKRRQFQKRQVEAQPIEADQRGPAVLIPSPPEVFGDHVGAELGLVEHDQVDQAEIPGHLGHGHRDRDLVGIGDKVAFVLLHQLGPIPAHRLGRLERLGGVAEPGHQLRVGSALDIEHQVANGTGHDRLPCARSTIDRCTAGVGGPPTEPPTTCGAN